MIHNLKIQKKFADAICAGAKNFEIRKEDDKHFEIGDVITFSVVDGNDYHGADGSIMGDFRNDCRDFDPVD